MNNTIDKIFHHFAFTFFWTLLLLVIITTAMRFNQCDNNQIKNCLDKGYSIKTCKGL